MSDNGLNIGELKKKKRIMHAGGGRERGRIVSLQVSKGLPSDTRTPGLLYSVPQRALYDWLENQQVHVEASISDHSTIANQCKPYPLLLS